MESVASTVRFLVPIVRSWGCTPGSGSGAVGERRAPSWVGGAQLTPPPRAPQSCRVALTISHADTRAQPAPASLAPQVGSQVEVAGGAAVLRQRQAGTQVGGPAAQARCLRPGHRLPVLAKPPRCPQPCSLHPTSGCIPRLWGLAPNRARGGGTGLPGRGEPTLVKLLLSPTGTPPCRQSHSPASAGPHRPAPVPGMLREGACHRTWGCGRHAAGHHLGREGCSGWLTPPPRNHT